MPTDLISTSQAAERAQVAPSTVTRAVSNGQLTPTWRGEGLTGVLLFDLRDVDRWIDSRRDKAAS